MAKRLTHQLVYRAIRIEGGLIPAEELTRLTLMADPKATEQTESQYRIAKGLKLRDEIARDFKIALNLWQDFKVLRQRKDIRPSEVTVREWLTPLLRDVLHFHDIARCAAIERAGHQYAVGHAGNGGRVPLVFAGFDEPLDAAAERFGETNPDTSKIRRRSPFMLAQETLNASDVALWAIVSNGLTLRILRDNASLTRPVYIEVDLEALFNEELLADFSAFWLLTHASRFGNADKQPGDCPWERWRAAGQHAGVTVRGKLRYQVAEALRALGTGFLSHPANVALRTALQSAEGGYDHQAFFEELLRLVYRLIFLATVEDRRDRSGGERLVFAPDASEEAKARYLASYSMTWLRERAVRRTLHDRHADLWQALTITFAALSRGESALGLPALGGLFDVDQCSSLDVAQLENRYLLAAVFQLGWFRADRGLSRVNYRDMGPEELGSVYESLLELVPELQGLASPGSARLVFVGDDEIEANTRGNKRKLTGSYYTPDSLVQELIRSALEPIIAQTVKTYSEGPVEALLSLTICDPACGSGHFLLSAARRLADEVALHRAAAEREGGAPTPTDYRHALRDVVSRCIFGVDKNPMAIQLAKTALWLEAYSPDRPLSFIDHHLRTGDALLGVLDPKVIENGIPDEAYTALSGDDKAVVGSLKKQNRAELKSWHQIATGDLLTQADIAFRAANVEGLDDDTPQHLTAKRQAWSQAENDARRSTFARLADTYVAAFLLAKVSGAGDAIPLSGYLWSIMSSQPLSAAIGSSIEKVCHQSAVFHWWLAFPQVAARGGFDVMLGNPPWERIKLQEEEFFANRSPLVAAAKNKAERTKRIDWLREGTLLHHVNPDLERVEGLEPPNRVEMALYESFITARRGAEAASLFAHNSRRYPLTGIGDVNTYALFAEVFLQATRDTGRAGFIVPTGIATDDSTKAYFEAVSQHRRLVALYSFENEEFVFPAVHHAMKFALVTTAGRDGIEVAPQLAHFARQVAFIHDERRRFSLTPEEFRLINPNTRTCPVFRSQRDSELTKKLYRAAPVLFKEAIVDESGLVVHAEVNPWAIRFQTMFHMSSDSGLFADSPSPTGAPKRLPLYEAKMIHQFDHRWATYIEAEDNVAGEVETADVSEAQKADPNFIVRPRYWVAEREVLARVALVPSRVIRAWIAIYDALAAIELTAIDKAQCELQLALAQWVSGELFHRSAGAAPSADGWSPQQSQPHIARVELYLKTRFPRLDNVLRGRGLTTKKALLEFPKWAHQDAETRLSDNELAALADACQTSDISGSLHALLDDWMDTRSPNWFFGFRNITNATNERTFIGSVVPRSAVGHSMPLMFIGAPLNQAAVLIASFGCLVLDYITRQKLGGTNMTYGFVKQFAVLPPDQYSSADLDFIVPRVFELTYTAHDLKPWADDLSAYDPRPVTERGRPFNWKPERRAHLRAELDAYFARKYGLTREELRYILDPKDVVGDDYPTETFRVLKEGELRTYGEYRTRRLVLEAWDRLVEEPIKASPINGFIEYSTLSMIRGSEEGWLAGLIAALLASAADGCTVDELQNLVARASVASTYLEELDARSLSGNADKHHLNCALELLDRIRPIVERLEAVGAVRRRVVGAVSRFIRGGGVLPSDVIQTPEQPEIARLLHLSETRRLSSVEMSKRSEDQLPMDRDVG